MATPTAASRTEWGSLSRSARGWSRLATTRRALMIRMKMMRSCKSLKPENAANQQGTVCWSS